MAYESIHTIKNKKKGKWGYCTVKLDMHKAYDRMEWNILRRMMTRLGFADCFVQLVMKCVTTVSCIFRNGDITNMVTLGRGVRQGDPILPYLFLLCVEGFFRVIKQGRQGRHIYGLKLGKLPCALIVVCVALCVLRPSHRTWKGACLWPHRLAHTDTL